MEDEKTRKHQKETDISCAHDARFAEDING